MATLCTNHSVLWCPYVCDSGREVHSSVADRGRLRRRERRDETAVDSDAGDTQFGAMLRRGHAQSIPKAVDCRAGSHLPTRLRPANIAVSSPGNWFQEANGHHPWETYSAGCFQSPSYRPWDHRCLWRMASATPDLQLLSKPQNVTADWPLTSYTAWWQRNTYVNELYLNNCPGLCGGWQSNLLTASPYSNHYETMQREYFRGIWTLYNHPVRI